MNVLKESFVFAKRYTPAWITVILLSLISVICLNLLPQAPQLIIDRVINPALGEAPVVNENNPFNFLLAGLAAAGYLAVSFWFLARTAGMLEVFVTAALAAGWFFKYLHMAKKEFGGVTGDLAGYYLQTSELLLLAGLAGTHLWQMGGWI